MCGVVGIVGQSHVNQLIYDALTVLQHRGQDAAGIMTSDKGLLCLQKGNGLVRDVLRSRHMMRLKGNVGIGHVRYPTAGSDSEAEAQPLYVNSPYGITLAHNGNLINSDALTRELFQDDLRHLNTTSDSEVLLNIFAHELQRQGLVKLQAQHVFIAISELHKRCRGAYAAVSMITNYGIVGFRDPFGIRPLVFGKRESENGTEYMIASESVALTVLGFTDVSDIAPGEAIFITLDGEVHRQQCAEQSQLSPCIFEHVYLARPDSFIDGISVYKVRLRIGKLLADKILEKYPDHDIDVVMPIPDTSRTAAFPLAQRLGVKYREGFVKNRYIGRTFIMPGQSERRKSVRRKLSTIGLEFQGKNVLLVDDSIVRGTTSKEIVNMAREAGAKKVYFASAAPEVRYPNVYGIDIPAAAELIAHGRTVDEICQEIGADWLIYQELEALYQAAQEGNFSITRFEDSVFTGDYVTGDVNDDYLQHITALRSDKTKDDRASQLSFDSMLATNSSIDLGNSE